MLPTRIVAAALALLGVLPLWRILPRHATGIAGAATAEQANAYSALAWNGVLLALIPAVIAALLLDTNKFENLLSRAVMPLTRPRATVYALVLALFATLLAAFVAIVIMDGRPTLIDSFAQLVHARYLAAGSLAGPVLPGQEFWHIQQTIATANGWVSQYPPGYVALLALGFLLRSVSMVGPVMFGVAVFFTALIAEDVFAKRALARFAALLAALSPFMLGMSGAFMSHVPAAAFSSAALYFVLRAQRGEAGAALAAGLSIGLLFTVRPLTGIVAGIVALGYGHKQPRQIALALVAAAPFIGLVAAYNAHFFGSPTTFGYNMALGPHAGLGFGTDPWGNRYGIVEALAYTSAELAALNVFLLETPLPLVLFVGLFFARSPVPHAPARLLFWWAAALVIADLFYWHHGLFMGPRMLADAGTLWVLLVVMSVGGLIDSIRADWLIADKYSPRAFATGGACAALLAGGLLLGPQRLFSYAPPADVAPLLRAPSTRGPALVFVHGGWTTRVAMRLAAHGMSLDSVESALRQNGTCSVHHFAVAYARNEKPGVQLDFTPRAVDLPPVVQLAPGDRIRIARGERIDAGCAAEMASDTAGIVDVSPYIWQGDLPGDGEQGALFVRDMGQTANAELIAKYPRRAPMILQEDKEGRIQVRPYADAMRSTGGAQ